MKKILIFAALVFAGCDEYQSNPTGWSATSDLTPTSSRLTTQVLTDPYGQKFLVVRAGSGVAITSYKEPVERE